MSKKSEEKETRDTDYGEWHVIQYIKGIMAEEGITAAAIARAIDKKPPTVEKWFAIPSRGKNHLKEIITGINRVLEQNNKEPFLDLSIVDPVFYGIYEGEIIEAARKSLMQTTEHLRASEVMMLSNIAYNMFHNNIKYAAFYELSPYQYVFENEIPSGGIKNGNSYLWVSDDVLYRTNPEWDSIERLHAEAEALANGTAETSDSDPYAGRWDIREKDIAKEAPKEKALCWAEWLKSRPADIPAPPELLQLLGILALEGIKFNAGLTFEGHYTMDNEQTK